VGNGPTIVQARAPYAVARALAATVVSVTGAAAAHTWAGGTVPTGPGLALVSAVVLAGGLLLFTRVVPMWALLPAVGAAQLGLHESFGLVAADPGHHVHQAHQAHQAMAAPDQGWTWQMVAAHLFVTALTALLWWAGHRAASYVVLLGTRAQAPVVVRRQSRPAGVPGRSFLVHLLAAPRRGPPPTVLPT
jgi:hypothetical protein